MQIKLKTTMMIPVTVQKLHVEIIYIKLRVIL